MRRWKHLMEPSVRLRSTPRATACCGSVGTSRRAERRSRRARFRVVWRFKWSRGV